MNMKTFRWLPLDDKEMGIKMLNIFIMSHFYNYIWFLISIFFISFNLIALTGRYCFVSDFASLKSSFMTTSYCLRVKLTIVFQIIEQFIFYNPDNNSEITENRGKKIA